MIVMSKRLQKIVDELKVTNAETYYHSLHVKSLAAKMIKLMNSEKIVSYTPEEIDYICKGAILHDIGKLSVKNVVLTKDSSLTKEEKQYISHHTRAGFELIRDELTEEEYDIVGNICLYHHERMDGSGYEGKTDIPVYVQIVSACDVFDALSTDRVYRKGLPYEETMRIMRDGGSGRFNEKILECLEKVTHGAEK